MKLELLSYNKFTEHCRYSDQLIRFFKNRIKLKLLTNFVLNIKFPAIILCYCLRKDFQFELFNDCY